MATLYKVFQPPVPPAAFTLCLHYGRQAPFFQKVKQFFSQSSAAQKTLIFSRFQPFFDFAAFAGTVRRSRTSPSGMVGWAMTASRNAV
jgi:hypothetical protein